MATAKNSLVDTVKSAALAHREAILQYNEKYKTDESAENGPRVLFQKGNTLIEENEASERILDARNDYEKALEFVQSARNTFVQAVAAQLGIEAQVEKPKPPKDEYEAAKGIMEKAQGAVKTLQTLAEYSPDLSEEVTSFIEANPLPSLARPAQERKEGPTAPKYRVDVTVNGENGEAVVIQGFTKTAQSVKNVTAADLREAYESAGGKGDGTFNSDVTVKELTFHIADRQKANA
ncbi:MAG: hypothetical protein ACREOB_00245 [Thermodesulfobacteriota bacterium]